MLEGVELSAIHEENARQLIRRLLNLIEKLSADLCDKQAEIQALRDENNHLKGAHLAAQRPFECAGCVAQRTSASVSLEPERPGLPGKRPTLAGNTPKPDKLLQRAGNG